MAETDFSLVDGRGRKYLTLQKRTRFLDAVRGDPRPEVRTFALTLVHTGYRISEAMRTRHKGLRELFGHDSGRRIPAHFMPHLRYILTMLDGARHPKDMDRPGLRLHPLKRQSSQAVECVGVGKLAHRLPLRMG